jgi:neopullulanase
MTYVYSCSLKFTLMNKILFLIFIAFSPTIMVKAQGSIEPPYWWVGMQQDTVQFLISTHSLDKDTKIATDRKDIQIIDVHIFNSNYVAVVVVLNQQTQAGECNFYLNNKAISTTFKIREGYTPKGYGPQDVVYLIMPDRFANGNAANDVIKGMEPTNRDDVGGRHGGDLQGIIDHLDYIKNLGITTIWLTPFQEMNQKKGSYHGYGMSNLYETDARFAAGKIGSPLNNLKYQQLVNACHQNDIKVIMDAVPNHIGESHPWFNSFPRLSQFMHDSSQCNFAMPANTDPYASPKDKYSFEKGWFVPSMPDMNQSNKYQNRYMIQNHIWWMEAMKIDGIRMDTQPFNDRAFVTAWNNAIFKEYPTSATVGESWGYETWLPQYYQANETNKDKYNSGMYGVMDFPVFNAIVDGLKNNDAQKLYTVLAQDFLYDYPERNFIFFGNHDTERFFTSVKENENKYRMGLMMWATLRGTPQLYYGDELAMTGPKGINDGLMRKDMPGGWRQDKKNIFTGEGYDETSMAWRSKNFTQKLLQWRLKHPVIFDGKTMHFFPKNNVYTYSRYNAENAILVISNFNNKPQSIDLNDYLDMTNKYKRVVSWDGKLIRDNKLVLEKEQTIILELNN